MSTQVLHHWEPENPGFWKQTGARVANRNLWISIPALVLAFSIWMLWSVVVVNLDRAGFRLSENQMFWLTAVPALSGATLRIFYSFLVPIFGGRKWTALSTASLLIPALGMGFALRDPTTSFPTLLILALLCGLGGANFSSSMANISFFFPKSRKGLATGLNAGIGNLGVSLVQFVVPVVITFSLMGSGSPQVTADAQPLWLQNAAFIWVPWILLTSVVAWFGMNDIADAKASFAAQATIFGRKDNWLMCVLYLGTFGSFIGYAAGFPLLIKNQFPGVNPLAYAWLGPLVGATMRPVGGWLADKLGGARVTFWNFIVMALAVLGVAAFLPTGGHGGSFTGFFLMFLVLFLTTGIGNGSTFRMIPVIFLNNRLRGVNASDAAAVAQATKEGNTEGAATLGFTAAMAAYGGFFIPKSYGTSISLTGGPEAALYVFFVFYLVCIGITWWNYARRNAPTPC